MTIQSYTLHSLYLALLVYVDLKVFVNQLRVPDVGAFVRDKVCTCDLRRLYCFRKQYILLCELTF